MHYSHALASSTRDCLDEDGVLHGGGLLEKMLRVLVLSVVAGDHRNSCLGHDVLGLTLAPHRGDGRGRGTDEGDSVLHTLLRKQGIFGKEAEARVECLAVGIPGDMEDPVLVEVGFG